MAKSIRAHLELASESEVRDIAKIDGRSVSSQPDEFVSANTLGYYVAINTLLMLVQAWSQHGWIDVLGFMKSHGLFELIRRFDQSATELISGMSVSFSIARALMRDISTHGPFLGIPSDDAYTMHTNATTAALFLFRYLKRFSPLKADVLSSTALSDFVDRQRELARLQRTPMSRFILCEVRDVACDYLDWQAIVNELNAVSVDDIRFTPGVSFDTRADLVSKLSSVAKARVEYFPKPFGIPMVAHGEATQMEYWPNSVGHEVHTVRLSAVPKNYKTARVIAPEDVVRQAYARRYFDLMDRYLPGEIKLHDQTQNQELARQGSVSGDYATIDLKAASDSITLTHLWAFFPYEFMKVMERVLPTHYVYEGKVRRLQSAATMGNSVTFWLESVLFACIAKAAVRYYNRWTGETDERISIYGDDIIVPTNAAATVIDWLTALGFVVNESKSFISRDLLYRESCGEEYWNGIRTTAQYYPRFPLEGVLGKEVSNRTFRDGWTNTFVDTMTSLIDLQHKMYYLCMPASRLISAIVMEAEPKMTQSAPDEGFQDLWAYESMGKDFSEPYFKLVREPVYGKVCGVKCLLSDGTKTSQLPSGFVMKIMGKWVKLSAEEVIPSNSGLSITVTAHYAPVTVYEEPKPNDREELMLHLYNYQQFLKFGPRYEDDLMRLLGVSAPPMSYRQAKSSGKVKWTYVK